jgi:hypothetical protein
MDSCGPYSEGGQSMTLKPFQLKIGGKVSGWRAIINGKVADVGDKGDTEEQAQSKVDKIIAEADKPNTPTGPTIGKLADMAGFPITKEADKGAPEAPKEADKPKPGEFRKNGLGELPAALLKKFRETFAASLSDANYTVDKAMFSIFGYSVDDIPEDTKTLLKIGWELACQQYFVDGVPPPWVIILFGNVQIFTKLASTAKEKKPAQIGTSDKPPIEPSNGDA